MENNFLPKWLVNGLGALLIAFIALLIVQQVYSFNQVVNNQKPANTIAVSGEGKISATPDLATVDVGVMTQASTATDAKNQNDQKVNQVIAFIKQQGIGDSDIKTQQLNLYPQQSYGGVMIPGGAPTTPKVTGYQANQTVEVKVHGVDKDQTILEKILDGAVNNGANEVDGVNFAFENPDALQQQAQQQAIANAKTKAQALAQTAGLSLGKVVSVSENGNGMPGPVPYALNAAMGMGGSAKSIAPDIQPGSQDITENMTVTFEVK
ncbi:MAG: SIMPL domain-containing protein [Candidatus Doudnabacteria bacterium]|nr:SIMPL domain-containing protein [Candidatus Doudnabacteria bacterium]